MNRYEEGVNGWGYTKENLDGTYYCTKEGGGLFLVDPFRNSVSQILGNEFRAKSLDLFKRNLERVLSSV